MHRPRSWRKSLLVLLAPAALFVNGCDAVGDITGDPHGDEEEVTLTLQNLDTPVIGLTVHLFGPGETFPAGRLDPGGSRTLIFDARPNEQIEVRAGRNGSIVATKSCTCTTACDKSGDGVARVEWNGSALACVGW